MKLLFIITWSFYTLAVAQATTESLSSKVSLNLGPYRGEEPLFGGEPSGESKEACRPSASNFATFQGTPAEKIIENLYPDAKDSFDESNTTISLSGQWMTFGLVIDNSNADGSYLIIDHLVFMVQSNDEKQVLNHVKVIKPGYCGLPFLYIIPPDTIQPYRITSHNPLKNLTLYVDNFPVIDPSETPPQYKMNVTLMGRFISENGEIKEPFYKDFEVPISMF